MSNHWVDIRNADLILIMGGNAAEAHPCGFKWVTEAKAHNNARLVVVDPRFTRSAAVADYYAPIRTGTDIAFLGGVINYLISNDRIQKEYVRAYTNATFLVNRDYAFADGLFSGYNEARRSYDRSTWAYEMGPDGYAVVDETMQHERSVYQILKRHYARYTPEMVTKICGTPTDAFLKIADAIAKTAAPDKVMTILYALGWTQHSQGTEIIRTAAIVQLLCGSIGLPGGGVNALRGHSNVQGLSDLGVAWDGLPGYMTMPRETEQDYHEYIKLRTLMPLRPKQMSYWQNYPKFHVSLMKAWYGNAATKENNWAYNYLPKYDAGYDAMRAFELMGQGKINGYICQGFNPLASFPDKRKIGAALAKLKYLVVIDPLVTETSEFWKNFGPHNDVDSAKIQTEVIRLPSTCFAEEEGSITNSGRWLQWHYKGADPPGEALSDTEIIAELFLHLKGLYAKEGGAYSDPILNLAWPYRVPQAPSSEELAQEFNGKALANLTDAKDPGKVLLPAGALLPGFAMLRDDGTTSCGCWIYSGAWTQAGNQMARRDNADPYGIGQTLNWAWAWPVNRRILYNRASADPSGKPWNPRRPLIYWDGKSWVGADVPDMRPDAAPDEHVNPFIMTAEGVARLFAPSGLADGPLPEHYEPFESPVTTNFLTANNPKAFSSPAARVFKGDLESFGKPKDFPYAATTYRLTEHFHFWTKHADLNAITQPQQFVEIGEDLAQEKGIRNGDRVKVRSNRGEIQCVACVTKRIKALDCGGTKVHTVGIPIHWGFTGLAKTGYLSNTLTPFVGDANTQTPEFKSFLVNIEKA
jgi:formate dehydrogenase major subunit